MPAPGTRIRDYEIWGLLGEGGMSEVWLAKDEVLSIPVMIKTLGKTSLSAPEASQRVLNEARTMARIPEPRIVRALNAGIHEGTPYLVQEYVDGIDIEELDAWRRKTLGVNLPLWFICDVMKETCRALHSAHQSGVIHRDVKPSNVFGSPETGVRLGDFGIAAGISSGQPSDICGTPSFMAPEQVRGEPIDRRTDVFGAGATAYVLRYGTPPFASLEELLDPAVSVAFPPPQHPQEGYFQHLLAAMLTKDPAARLPNAAMAGRHFAMIEHALRSSLQAAPLVCLSDFTFRLLDCTIVLEVGDLAEATVDGVVSSGNYDLRMRTGVGDALRRRGGDSIEDEALQNGEQALGTCVPTRAGRLRAKRVLHAVSGWNEISCIGRATQRAFLLGDELGLRSLAFPALGTGAARISVEACANAMMTALRSHLALGGTRLEMVRVVFDTPAKRDRFRSVAEEALRAEEDPPTLIDLGLPVAAPKVGEHSATHLDLSRHEALRSTVPVR
ncbi:serine/threonine-protein kinase [Pendulispora albinea]|uniref:Serine/threonine-protein kinase n=1 Tax=Pendulispora albinea TaxID=2741071 RepID=A0ABZ2LSJ0_9BACT